MAELATIARPYAEALFEVAANGDLAQSVDQLTLVAGVAADPQLRQFADDPKTRPEQVFDVIAGVLGRPLSAQVANLLRTVIENGRLAALPEVAHQFRAQASARSGIAEATIYSAFPIEPAQLPPVVGALEKRFGRRINATVALDPELIGGIRVVVGDEVLDTSVKARLEAMKHALTA